MKTELADGWCRGSREIASDTLRPAAVRAARDSTLTRGQVTELVESDPSHPVSVRAGVARAAGPDGLQRGLNVSRAAANGARSDRCRLICSPTWRRHWGTMRERVCDFNAREDESHCRPHGRHGSRHVRHHPGGNDRQSPVLPLTLPRHGADHDLRGGLRFRCPGSGSAAFRHVGSATVSRGSLRVQQRRTRDDRDDGSRFAATVFPGDFGGLTLFAKCGRQDFFGDGDAMLFRPRHLLSIGEATALLPALFCGTTAARTILARKGLRPVLPGIRTARERDGERDGDERQQHDQAQQPAHHESTGCRLPETHSKLSRRRPRGTPVPQRGSLSTRFIVPAQFGVCQSQVGGFSMSGSGTPRWPVRCGWRSDNCGMLYRTASGCQTTCLRRPAQCSPGPLLFQWPG